MRPFAYERPQSVPSALALAQAPEAAYLAGGTNLLDHLKLNIKDTSALIDLRGVDDEALRTIAPLPAGGLRVGALVKNSALAADVRVMGQFPVLSQAILAGASGQIRNMASTGGNLLQRTRCVYFQDTSMPCNKRQPGTGCSAKEGFGRYNAILGTSPECVAVHPSDMCVALTMLDTTVTVQGQAGERRIPFGEFHRLPGDTPQLDTNLQPGELIMGLDIEPLSAGTRSGYRKVRDRASYAFALVSVAAALRVESGIVREVRLAFGGAAHKPWRATLAEAQLTGQAPTTENFMAALDAELAHARPGHENAFKVPMLRNAACAVLEELSLPQQSQSQQATA